MNLDDQLCETVTCTLNTYFSGMDDEILAITPMACILHEMGDDLMSFMEVLKLEEDTSQRFWTNVVEKWNLFHSHKTPVETFMPGDENEYDRASGIAEQCAILVEETSYRESIVSWVVENTKKTHEKLWDKMVNTAFYHGVPLSFVIGSNSVYFLAIKEGEPVPYLQIFCMKEMINDREDVEDQFAMPEAIWARNIPLGPGGNSPVEWDAVLAKVSRLIVSSEERIKGLLDLQTCELL